MLANRKIHFPIFPLSYLEFHSFTMLHNIYNVLCFLSHRVSWFYPLFQQFRRFKQSQATWYFSLSWQHSMYMADYNSWQQSAHQTFIRYLSLGELPQMQVWLCRDFGYHWTKTNFIGKVLRQLDTRPVLFKQTDVEGCFSLWSWE